MSFLEQIQSSGVVLQSWDLQLSRNALYLLSHRLSYLIALRRDLFVYRDGRVLSSNQPVYNIDCW